MSDHIDVEAFLAMMDANATALKDQIGAVIDFHMGGLADKQGMTEMLQAIGTLIQQSTSEPRAIKVTVDFA
ncbi:MAG: hypothetical protein EOP84_31590 [Verrucomicrobiaceae bacterium]|nr:MAG: hypothetical protein EOP84_31590 [Verrucomicrobiaceae bacterium]